MLNPPGWFAQLPTPSVWHAQLSLPPSHQRRPAELGGQQPRQRGWRGPQPPLSERSCTFPPWFHVALLVSVKLPDVHEDLPLEAGHSDITHLPNLQ